MYFPYFRGRQYELIALREMLQQKTLSQMVLPIIEPVKASSTLLITLQEFISNRHNVAVIMNPLVGDFRSEIARISNDLLGKYNSLMENEYIIPAYLINNKLNFIEVERENKEIIAVCKTVDDVDMLSKNKTLNVLYSLIPESNSAKRRISYKKIEFSDKFIKRDRNSEYAKNVDEFFSEDNLYFKEDGYVGFADYSIIGKDYIESGFAPFAVAIHMVYFDENNRLLIHHFVSDSNDDINNPQGKFGEALGKLVVFEEWKQEKNQSNALQNFFTLFDVEEYHGLGYVKKLSIMHHLELISRFLEENN